MWAIESGLARSFPVEDPRLRCTSFGKRLPHPVGLAAGFDKDGDALNAWASLGFAFVELGTVTLRPQMGNKTPRLFRLPQDDALINRMGFNNAGLDELERRLSLRRTPIPVGVNIGRNRDTKNEDAVEDYAECARRVHKMADYIAVNVSSPNTPGLRLLQGPESLGTLLKAVVEASQDTPVFVKVSPDSTDDELKEVTDVCRSERVKGIIATNTTVKRTNLRSNAASEEGGLSGRPLRSRAEQVCKLLRTYARDELEIIGVGGIFTGDDLFRRLAAGANACQIYTAFVYRGPHAVSRILHELLERMDKEGITDLSELASRWYA